MIILFSKILILVFLLILNWCSRKNGTGKTTFLKTVIGNLIPTSGEAKIASNVKFNYVDQERIKLDETKSVYDEIGEGYDFVKWGDEKLSIWAYLKRFYLMIIG